jgi:hypothetical protein
MFIPLRDRALSSCVTACFAWSTSDASNWNRDLELPYCVTFCHCVMAEIAKLDTMVADQQKQDFIGSISHELRSPLHGILASVEFLGETRCDVFQKSLVDTVDSCGRTLLDTITKSRLSHKKIFIVDEVSMVGLENLVQLNDRCNTIWDLNRSSDTVFGGIPIVIFLGDFNQFKPVRGHAIWSQNINDITVLKSAKTIWGHFTRVVFLTEQMRQAEDLPFQDLLQRG